MASLQQIMQQYKKSQTETTKPQGTLHSTGLFYQPPVPGQSQAQGLQGTDGLGYTRTVGDNELATNRLNQITNQNSQYMQNAARRGLETANRRGLLNSSIASGSSQRAALEAATPLALQEAQAYQAAQQENLAAMNANLQQTRSIANDMLGQQRQLQDNESGRSAAAANQRAQIEAQLRAQREQLAFQGEQAGLDRAHQVGMSDMEFNQNLAQLGYQYDFQSREADRDVYRQIALSNNQFSNQRFNNAYQTLLDSNITNSTAAFMMMLQQLYEDPNTSLTDLEGFRNWTQNQSNLTIDGLFDRFLGGG